MSAESRELHGRRHLILHDLTDDFAPLVIIDVIEVIQIVLRGHIGASLGEIVTSGDSSTLACLLAVRQLAVKVGSASPSLELIDLVLLSLCFNLSPAPLMDFWGGGPGPRQGEPGPARDRELNS